MNLADPRTIPGMIELVEQENLFELTKNLDLKAGEAVVEFGTFFGRSTCCILNGFLANPDRGQQSLVVAYDGFSVPRQSSFAPHLVAHAKSGSAEALLEVHNDRIGFKKVLEHYLGEYAQAGLLRVVESPLQDSEWTTQPIRMMHIDSPKIYSEFRYILFRFFPSLCEGGYVIFQDFFFQWSGTLIAAVQLLVEHGLLEYKYSVASSMVMEVKRRPEADVLAKLDLVMQKSDLPGVIERAKAALVHIKIDRPQSFVPRLDLAKIQYLWHAGRYRAATDMFASVLTTNNPVPASLLHDFMDLMRAGFDIDRVGD